MAVLIKFMPSLCEMTPFKGGQLLIANLNCDELCVITLPVLMRETLRKNTAIIQDWSNFTSFNEISAVVDPTFQKTLSVMKNSLAN